MFVDLFSDLLSLRRLIDMSRTPVQTLVKLAPPGMWKSFLTLCILTRNPLGAKRRLRGVWQRQEARLPEWIDALGRDKPLIWVYSGNPRYAHAPTPIDSIVVIRAAIESLFNHLKPRTAVAGMRRHATGLCHLQIQVCRA